MLRGWLYRGEEYHHRRRRGRRVTNRSGRARSLRLTLEPLESRTVLSFSAPVALDLGLASARVAVADANGDNIPDLLAASGNTVSVLLGQGNGTFQSPLLSNPGPAGSMVGDVNGDGVPDLAGLEFNEDGYIEALNTVLGNGDGTFRPGARFAFAELTVTVTPGDFDGDGRFDLLTNNRVFLGNGDGTFRPTSSTPSLPSIPRVADFNGDGRLDLATISFGNSVSVLLGNGDGTFQTPVAYGSGLQSPSSLGVADFNGDGLPDLLAGGGVTPGRVSVLFGIGDGTFQSALTTDLGSVSGGTAADLNGDGFADLIAAAGAGQLRVLLGNGDGTFQSAVSYVAGPAPFLVGVADFTGDGAPDLAVATFLGDFGRTGSFVSVLVNNGDGTFPSFTAPHAVGSSPGALATGDFNGDGSPDLVTASSLGGGTLSVVLGNGDGTFRPAVTIGLSALFPHSVAVADFNGDGNLDLAVTITQQDKVVILPGRGDGTFEAPRNVPTGRFPGPLVVRDLNSDGIPDLAVLALNASAAAGVYVHLGNGDGTFGSAMIAPVDQFFLALAAGDFNGDGIPDLAVSGSATFTHGQVSVLVGNGDGTFQQPIRYAVGLGPRAVAVVRLRPDGPEDLITVNGAIPGLGNSISVLLGNGDGTFQGRVDYPVGRGPFGVAVEDFNGDGLADVAVANSDDGTVSVLLGMGDGSLIAGPRFVVGHRPLAVVVGDFNGDHRPDLMVANGSSSNVSILLNDGNW